MLDIVTFVVVIFLYPQFGLDLQHFLCVKARDVEDCLQAPLVFSLFVSELRLTSCGFYILGRATKSLVNFINRIQFLETLVLISLLLSCKDLATRRQWK